MKLIFKALNSRSQSCLKHTPATLLVSGFIWPYSEMEMMKIIDLKINNNKVNINI